MKLTKETQGARLKQTLKIFHAENAETRRERRAAGVRRKGSANGGQRAERTKRKNFLQDGIENLGKPIEPRSRGES